ncbi:hypothetical protein L1887_37935 [Cichorium endivia]|nr:hypothetical protein L1887_37935 [Cichorium endivia]
MEIAVAAGPSQTNINTSKVHPRFKDYNTKYKKNNIEAQKWKKKSLYLCSVSRSCKERTRTVRGYGINWATLGFDGRRLSLMCVDGLLIGFFSRFFRLLKQLLWYPHFVSTIFVVVAIFEFLSIHERLD